MIEESIYRILDPYVDHEKEKREMKEKRRTELLSKKPRNVPPTYSTFINHNTVRSGVANPGGHLEETYFLQQHKKAASTLGSIDHLSKSIKNKNNISNNLPPIKVIDYKNAVPSKPKVPNIKDAPIHGLSSNVNFIKSNINRTLSLKPKKTQQKQDFLKKKEYGQAPSYLSRVKDAINREKEYIEMIRNSNSNSQSNEYDLSKEEVESLKKELKQKHKEITLQYQGLTHVSKVYPKSIKVKKESYEAQLKEIEDALKLLENDIKVKL